MHYAGQNGKSQDERTKCKSKELNASQSGQTGVEMAVRWQKIVACNHAQNQLYTLKPNHYSYPALIIVAELQATLNCYQFSYFLPKDGPTDRKIERPYHRIAKKHLKITQHQLSILGRTEFNNCLDDPEGIIQRGLHQQN